MISVKRGKKRMNKTLSYIITAIGLIIFALSFQSVQTALKLKLPSSLSTNVLTIISIIILAVGLFLIVKTSSGEKVKEVPIYKGKDIVGFRRVGK